MTVQYSIQKMVSDGTLSTIALGIQYLQRNDIYMRIAGEETPQSGATSGYTWTFLNNTTLRITPVVPNGGEVVVYRRTDVGAMYNIYSQNAQFDEATIDENNEQLLYLAQEYLEQGIPGAGVDSLEYINTVAGINYYRFRLTDGTITPPFGVPDGTVELRSALAAPTGPSNIGTASGTNLYDYLLKGDGIDPDMINGPLNDVGRLQAAVNLWATDRTKWIKLGRSYDLTGGTIYVANPESYVPESQLVIFGGELKKLDAGYMFDKPLGIGQVESTGGLRFKGTRFLGPKVAGTYIINGHHDSLGVDDSTHIIRVAFEGCMGVGIQAVHARPDGYIQTITFDSNCVWRRWAGYIVDTGRLYDVQMINMRSEAGDAVIRTRDDDAPVACNGLIILGGNIEGNLGTSGPAINVGVCWGTSISSVYMELNYGGDIDCSRSYGFHRGLSIHGVKCEPTPAQLANPKYYPFELGWGVDGSFDLGGNTSTGNLYNCGVNNPASIMDSSSSCGVGYKKFSPNILRKVNFTSDGFEATSALGGAVGADYGNSLFYCQDPRTTDTSERAYTGVTHAEPTAIAYPGVVFGKGSFLFNRNAAQEARSYGGVSRIVEVLGWKCVETGAPGVWREIVVMVPYA